MSIPAAILLGLAILAAAVTVTFRYEVVLDAPEGVVPRVIRLNRLTGHIDFCVADPDTMRNPNSLVGANFTCQAK